MPGMRKYVKGGLIACSSLAALCLALFHPAMPWSIQCRHSAHRVYVQGQMRLATWRGHLPRLASVTGSLRSGGIQIEALDSRSGWATLADNQGHFVLRDVMWYPGARYDLILADDSKIARHFTVAAPDSLSESGLIDVGSVSLDETCEFASLDLPGLNSITYLDYDSGNTEYYRKVFSEQADRIDGDESRIQALNRFVAHKLNYDEGAGDFEAARRTLERGSRYCGCLGIALAAIAEAGNYDARVIDLCDGQPNPSDHAVVEVYYRGGWHLYDPYFGVSFKTADGRTASYRDVRLDTGLLATAWDAAHASQIPSDTMVWMRGVYSSGIHHFYYFKKTGATCVPWWPFNPRKDHHAISASALAPPSILAPLTLLRMVHSVVEHQQALRREEGRDARICKRCQMTAQYALSSYNKAGPTEVPVESGNDKTLTAS